MNTKTTKFLAVLAVFAMVFCVTAVAVQTDADDSIIDRVTGEPVEVDGLYVHFADTLDATVIDNEVSFEGTVAAGHGTLAAFTSDNYAYASISGLGDITNKVTRIVQTNSALAAFGITKDTTSGLFIKDKNDYNVKWSTAGQTTATGTNKEDFVFAIPQDASSVKLQFYSGSVGAYVLEKEILLDFADTYTQVKLDTTAPINSQEKSMDAKATSYWSYTAAGALTLNNYTGNTVFNIAKDDTTITVKGINNLGYVTKDGTKATPFQNATKAPIYSAGKLTISGDGSLSIDVKLGQYNSGKAAAIWSDGDLGIADLANLNIDLKGSAHYKEPSIKGPMEHGLFSEGNITVGTPTSTLPVKMSIALDSICSAGIGSYKDATLTHKLYISGSIEAGNRAIHTNYGTLKIENSGTADEPLVLSGYEAAIKTYADTATAVINNSYLDLNLNETGGVYAGDDILAALNIGGPLEVDKDSYIETQGYSGKRDKSAIPAVTFAGKLVVTDDYTQNPKAVMDTVIPGFYYKGTTTITAYDYVPTSSSYIYLDFDNKDNVYGAVTVMNEGGYADKEVITNLTTDDIKDSFAKTVVYVGKTINNDVVVPETKTLLIEATGALGDKTITCGDNVIGTSGFVGTMKISKDGVTISNMSAGALTGAKGKITVTGTAAGSIAVAASGTVAVTLDDSLSIGAFTLNGAKGTMTVSATDLTVTGAFGLTSAKTTVNGTITEKGGVITIKDCDLNLASGAVAVTTNGKEFISLVKTEQGKGSFTISDGAIFAKADKATGFNYAGSLKIKAGTAVINGFNITNFKATASGDNEVAIEGTITNGNAKSDYAAITFATDGANVAAGKTLTINNGVLATATKLTVNGTFVAKGVITSDTGFVLADGGVIDMTAATYGGAIVFASNKNIAFEYNNLDHQLGTVKNAMSGFTLKSVKNSSDKYDTKLEGNLKIVGDLDNDNDTQNVTIGANATIISDDGITIVKGVQIVLKNTATLKSKITGPEGVSATFNVQAAADSTITGGSLTIEGTYTKNGSTGAITIPAGSNVTMFGTINDGVTVTVEKGATVTVPNGQILATENADGAKIVVKEGAEITGVGTGKLTAGKANNIDVYGTLSIDTAGDVKYETGSSSVKVEEDGKEYLMSHYTNGDKTYAIGTLVQSFDNKAVVKEDLGFIIETTDGYTLGASTLLNINMKAVGVYSDKPTEVVVQLGSTTATVYPSVKIAETKVTITYSTTGTAVEGSPFTMYVTDTTTTLASLHTDGKLPTTTKADSKFLGWAISGVTPIVYVTEKSTLAEITNYENVTLVAMWKDLTTSTFTVTFDSNGGSEVPAQTDIAYKGTVTEPAAPTKSGYTFVGWYTDKDLTTKYNFKALVVDDLTLYAKWTASKPTATAVDVAIAKTTGGVKVTVAGEGDLIVPAGTVTVKYAYWITIESTKILQWKTVTETMTMGPIVNSVNVTISETPVFVEASYLSEDGKVTGSTPRIVY